MSYESLNHFCSVWYSNHHDWSNELIDPEVTFQQLHRHGWDGWARRKADLSVGLASSKQAFPNARLCLFAAVHSTILWSMVHGGIAASWGMEKVLFGTQKWLLLPLGTPVDQPWVKVGGWIVLRFDFDARRSDPTVVISCSFRQLKSRLIYACKR